MYTERGQGILGLELKVCWYIISGHKQDLFHALIRFYISILSVPAQYQFKTIYTVDQLRQRKDLNTNFMIILEICQKQPFDVIGITSRGNPGLCCVYIAQLMTHPTDYTLRFILQWFH